MAISIDGSGIISGVSVGGLPDGTVDTDMLAANAVTEPKLGADQASGLAKAWVNFNGSGTLVINDSFNVASLTDNGTGQYTVNFTTSMSSANYAVAGMASDSGSASVVVLSWEAATTSGVSVQCIRNTSGFSDQGTVNVVIFED